MKPKKPRRWWLALSLQTQRPIIMDARDMRSISIPRKAFKTNAYEIVPVQEILPKKGKKK